MVNLKRIAELTTDANEAYENLQEHEQACLQYENNRRRILIGLVFFSILSVVLGFAAAPEVFLVSLGIAGAFLLVGLHHTGSHDWAQMVKDRRSAREWESRARNELTRELEI